jgi:glycopeptide antibiotics resistance protein
MRELNDITILHFRGDYFFHTFMFMPWAFFITNFKTSIWLWLILGLIFASGSELIQYYLRYRAFNINDLLANSIGIVLGYIGFYFYTKYKNLV